jgi:hypothetical protein
MTCALFLIEIHLRVPFESRDHLMQELCEPLDLRG